MIVMAKERKKEKEEFGSLFEYYGFTKKDEREYPVVSGILRKLTREIKRSRLTNSSNFIKKHE